LHAGGLSATTAAPTRRAVKMLVYIDGESSIGVRILERIPEEHLFDRVVCGLRRA
jgi:hypothetical protein